jgi:hypothetical protein
MNCFQTNFWKPQNEQTKGVEFMGRRKIPPLTGDARAVVIDALTYVQQLLILKAGVQDGRRTLQLCEAFIRALDLQMPPMCYPDSESLDEDRYEVLTNRQIDSILDELAIASEHYRLSVTAKISDAAIKFERHLFAIRGRENGF